MSPRAVSLLVALRDHGGRCCTPPVFVCEGAPEPVLIPNYKYKGWKILFSRLELVISNKMIDCNLNFILIFLQF
jgi:hypothetical protein